MINDWTANYWIWTAKYCLQLGNKFSFQQTILNTKLTLFKSFLNIWILVLIYRPLKLNKLKLIFYSCTYTIIYDLYPDFCQVTPIRNWQLSCHFCELRPLLSFIVLLGQKYTRYGHWSGIKFSRLLRGRNGNFLRFWSLVMVHVNSYYARTNH